jgi:hypothetical protein
MIWIAPSEKDTATDMLEGRLAMSPEAITAAVVGYPAVGNLRMP